MALDISDNDVYAAVADILKMVLPTGTPIIRGQQNRVAMPNVSCAVMTTVGAPRRVGTNVDALIETNQGWTVDSNVLANSNDTVDSGEVTFEALVTADFEYSLQVDFYSAETNPPTNPLSESWAMATELLWRDKIAWYAMPKGIKPLYSEDRRQLPIIGGENQWVSRWAITLVLDYQPTLILSTDAALNVDVVGVPVRVYFSSYVSTWPADSDVVTADSIVPA
jgi:hypothetical protein